MLLMADRRIEEAKRLIEQLNIPVLRIASYLGTTNTTLGHILSGETKNPRDETLVPRMLDYLRGLSAETLSSPKLPVFYESQPMRYAGIVPAGEWGDPLESEEFVDVDPALWHSRRFVCAVEGHSCSPALVPGDTTIWHFDNSPPFGMIVLAQRKGDHGCTVKVLEWDTETSRPRLSPLNPDIGEPSDGDGWGVIGRLVCVLRRTDGIETRFFAPEGLRPRHLTNLF